MGIASPQQEGTGPDFSPVVFVVSRKPYAGLIVRGVFDVLVSSDDTRLSMGPGVSGELARLGGASYVQAARQLLPAKVGDVLASEPGDLPCRHVLHAITLDRDAAGLPTERTVRQLARETFARCESLGATSILLPLVAAGSARFPAVTSARLLLEVLLQHLANPSVLRHVVVSVPADETYEACRQVLPPLLSGTPAAARVDLRFPNPSATLPGALMDAVDERPVMAQPSERKSITFSDSWDAAADEPRPAAPPSSTQAPVAASEAPPARSVGRGWLGAFLARLLGKASVPPAPEPEPPDATALDRTAVEVPRPAPTATPGKASAPVSPSRSPTKSASSGREPATTAERAPSSHTRPVLARRYVLLEELGRGGFGIVHLSWDLVLRRVVAIKQLRSDRRLTSSLLREAAIALELTHEAIVRTYHFEPEHDGCQAFLVMEYVPWPTAERWLAHSGGQLPPPHVVVELGIRVCEALEFAHTRQVLHLDLKPANLFVDMAAERVKLSDFGLARLATREGRVLPEIGSGTPAYMAPEQSIPGARVSPATDCYQLGATLWDLLLGETPRGTQAIPPGVDSERQRVLRAIRPALEPESRNRPASASAMRELLRQAG